MNTLKAQLTYLTGQRLEIVHGDLTQERVDAIVNAANAQLAHGGGVAAAIVRSGGQVIQEESYRWVQEHGPVSNSEPAVTGAGRLPCRYVIHAVGPVWGEGEEDHKLAQAVQGSLRAADRLELTSIAFPAISTGIFGFPKARAVPIFLDCIRTYFESLPHSSHKLVRITLVDPEMIRLFTSAVQDYSGPMENS